MRTIEQPGACLERRHVLALLGAFGVAPEALAQDAARANPRSYSVVFENEQVRVLEYLSRPGLGVCGQDVHSHPRHLSIAMTDVKARITLADGRTLVVASKAGDVFWEEAVTHKVENIGGAGTRAYMVELKAPGHVGGTA